jgi:glycosyltransferase involved in cell wall biosynthesis
MLQVLQLYYEPQPSGQTTHVLSLVRCLDRRRYQVTVALPAHLEGPIEAFRQLGVHTILLPLLNRRWLPQASLALARWLRREPVDVLHVHSQEAGLFARALGRLAGRPAILYTPQSIDIRRARWQAMYARWERMAAHWTDQIIAVDEADRRRLIHWGIPAWKVVTIPNGIDVADPAFTCLGPGERSRLLAPLGLDPTRPVVMQVGRLSAQKDPLSFVAGAAQVADACPDVQLVLVGDGPLRDDVVTTIRRTGLGTRIFCAGWLDQARRLMAAADIITLTSRWEGMPYALLEAMACGRPVVATAVNGCPELVVDGLTGFLVPPGDVSAWAQRVIQVVKNPVLAASLGQSGRQRVEEQFSLPRLVARIESLYDLCLRPAFPVQ